MGLFKRKRKPEPQIIVDGPGQKFVFHDITYSIEEISTSKDFLSNRYILRITLYVNEEDLVK